MTRFLGLRGNAAGSGAGVEDAVYDHAQSGTHVPDRCAELRPGRVLDWAGLWVSSNERMAAMAMKRLNFLGLPLAVSPYEASPQFS
jgi:hypothetical protein